MVLIFRLAIVVIVFVAAYYFIFWLPLAFLPEAVPMWARNAISLFCAGALAVSLWKGLGSARSTWLSSVVKGAVIFGAVGFIGGFFGPIIFNPQANQGPMLGIFITGPLGFLFGGFGGFAYWMLRR